MKLAKKINEKKAIDPKNKNASNNPHRAKDLKTRSRAATTPSPDNNGCGSQEHPRNGVSVRVFTLPRRSDYYPSAGAAPRPNVSNVSALIPPPQRDDHNRGDRTLGVCNPKTHGKGSAVDLRRPIKA